MSLVFLLNAIHMSPKLIKNLSQCDNIPGYLPKTKFQLLKYIKSRIGFSTFKDTYGS